MQKTAISCIRIILLPLSKTNRAELLTTPLRSVFTVDVLTNLQRKIPQKKDFLVKCDVTQQHHLASKKPGMNNFQELHDVSYASIHD